MDKLNNYREKIKQLLTQYMEYKPSYGDVEIETIFDKDKDHYQLICIGWNDQKRIYNPMIHIDIKKDKIWIQQNTTEIDIALELMEMGIQKSDIVIGFNTVKMRELSGFAIE